MEHAESYIISAHIHCQVQRFCITRQTSFFHLFSSGSMIVNRKEMFCIWQDVLSAKLGRDRLRQSCKISFNYVIEYDEICYIGFILANPCGLGTFCGWHENKIINNSICLFHSNVPVSLGSDVTVNQNAQQQKPQTMWMEFSHHWSPLHLCNHWRRPGGGRLLRISLWK